MVIAEKMPVKLSAPEDLERVLLSALEHNVPRELRSHRIYVFSFGFALPDRIGGNLARRLELNNPKTRLSGFREERERVVLAEIAPFTDLAILEPRTVAFQSGAKLFVENLSSVLWLLARSFFLNRNKAGPGRPLEKAFQHFVVHEVSPPGLPEPKTWEHFDFLVVKALLCMFRLGKTPLLLLVHDRFSPFVQIFVSVYSDDGEGTLVEGTVLESLWDGMSEESILLSYGR